jgi:hypothetical protein
VLKSPVAAERHTREIRESSWISGEDGSLRGQSGGCDHEVMSTPGPALLADDNPLVRMGLGDVNVVVDGLVKFATGMFDIDEAPRTPVVQVNAGEQNQTAS